MIKFKLKRPRLRGTPGPQQRRTLRMRQPELLIRVAPGMLLLGTTLVVGTIGFYILEDWSLLDSLYATVLIVSTLGFGVLQPTSDATKILSILLIGGGVGVLYYVLGFVAQQLVETQVGLRRERHLLEQIKKLKNHTIVCGYGRVGQEVVRELERQDEPLIVLDRNLDRIERARKAGLLAYQGDATLDTVLHAVGIERAKGMAICTESDAVNVFVTLSARALNDTLVIVARSMHEDDEPKLLRAGANRAITPAGLGGRRLAGLILRPTVIDFLDVLVHSDELEMWIEEFKVSPGSALKGKTILTAGLRDQLGITVLAIKDHTGTLHPNPHTTTVIGGGDILVVLGPRSSFKQLAEACGLTP